MKREKSSKEQAEKMQVLKTKTEQRSEKNERI